MKDPEKSYADSAARSCKGYKKDLRRVTMIVLHEAVGVSYLKDPEKSCAQNRESYLKDLEKSRADCAARSCKSYKKDLEKSH